MKARRFTILTSYCSADCTTNQSLSYLITLLAKVELGYVRLPGIQSHFVEVVGESFLNVDNWVAPVIESL